MQRSVLCPVADGFEEIELITPVDLLRRAGVDVVIAALGDARLVSGRCGVMIEADACLDALDASGFDLLLISGGPGVAVLRADGRPAALAGEFFRTGRLVAAICAGPLVLADAGLLDGRRFTAHFSTAGELPGAAADEPVVIDGPVVTARGAGTALEFGLALVGLLRGAGKADEVARSVMR